MRVLVLVCLLFCCSFAVLHKKKLGVFSQHTDIGSPKNAGDASYDRNAKAYTLKGSGYNIWFQRDEFHYAYKKLSGDFIITGNFELLGKGTDPHRKTGWMVRESLADSASHISGVLHGDGLTVLQWRVKAGMKMRDPEDEIFAKSKGYKVMQLERKGNMITMRAGKPGQPLDLIGAHEMANFPKEIYAGIYICSHNPEVTEEAMVTMLTVEKK